MIYTLFPNLNSPASRTLASPGPKRILALDGGGTRGIITLAFLERIEASLQAEHGRGDDFVLSDYFDLIGGTSVGSIIATQLAMGERVAAVRARFEDWAPEIFKPKLLHKIRNRFDAGPLTRKIQSVVGHETIGSSQLKTGLCIVMKRMDTGSVWPIANNPHHPYWNAKTFTGTNAARRGNCDYKLWELIRSSTAAPTYFSSHKIGIFEGLHDGETQGVFIDGAVSPHNNPALQLFMMAGIKGYNLGGADLKVGPGKAWPLGADNLLLISVGTGSFATKVLPGRIPHWDAAQALQGMIADGSDLGLTLLQWMSQSRAPWVVDRVARDLAGDALHVEGAPAAPLLSFQRYDMKLEHDGLNKGRTPNVALAELARLQELVEPKNMARLYELAQLAAKQQVHSADFPTAFRLPRARATS
jgi:uncharacterized protein